MRPVVLNLIGIDDAAKRRTEGNSQTQYGRIVEQNSRDGVPELSGPGNRVSNRIAAVLIVQPAIGGAKFVCRLGADEARPTECIVLREQQGVERISARRVAAAIVEIISSEDIAAVEVILSDFVIEFDDEIMLAEICSQYSLDSRHIVARAICNVHRHHWSLWHGVAGFNGIRAIGFERLHRIAIRKALRQCRNTRRRGRQLSGAKYADLVG